MRFAHLPGIALSALVLCSVLTGCPTLGGAGDQTQSMPPTVVSLSTEEVQATFGGAVESDSVTINVTLAGTTVAGTVALSSNNTVAIFTPNESLQPGTTYTAQISYTLASSPGVVSIANASVTTPGGR